ncbi:MAG: hypothetical protein V1824_00525 [archaeon]
MIKKVEKELEELHNLIEKTSHKFPTTKLKIIYHKLVNEKQTTTDYEKLLRKIHHLKTETKKLIPHIEAQSKLEPAFAREKLHFKPK